MTLPKPDALRTSRHVGVRLSPHERLVIAFYRSLPLERQLEIDGLFGVFWREPDVAQRFSAQVRELDLTQKVAGRQMLLASDVKPFIEEARNVIGIERRAA